MKRLTPAQAEIPALVPKIRNGVLFSAMSDEQLATLEAEKADGFRDMPALYDVVVARRNLAWADRVQSFLDSEDDYLVVVGALHLVGDDSVVSLLRNRGLVVRQR